MSYIDIEILESFIRLVFNNISVTDNVSTSMSKSSITSLSMSADGFVKINLSDGRVWNVSCLSEYIQDTYPIRNIGGNSVSTNSDLYTTLESIL
jgi:hypothetical protein